MTVAGLFPEPEREPSPLEQLSRQARCNSLAALGAAMDMQRAGIPVDWVEAIENAASQQSGGGS